jgi:hypothetical protein
MARCGVYLSTNFASIREGSARSLTTPAERAAELLLPFDVLSRVDLILSLARL